MYHILYVIYWKYVYIFYSVLYSITVHSILKIMLHYIPLCYMVLHSITLYYVILRYTTL